VQIIYLPKLWWKVLFSVRKLKSHFCDNIILFLSYEIPKLYSFWQLLLFFLDYIQVLSLQLLPFLPQKLLLFFHFLYDNSLQCYHLIILFTHHDSWTFFIHTASFLFPASFCFPFLSLLNDLHFYVRYQVVLTYSRFLFIILY
jgi:hypothetical protein